MDFRDLDLLEPTGTLDLHRYRAHGSFALLHLPPNKARTWARLGR